jgi:hypothetical protein
MSKVLKVDYRVMALPYYNGRRAEDIDSRLNENLEEHEENLINIDIIRNFQSEGYTLVDDIEMEDGFIPIKDYIDVLEEGNRWLMKIAGLL